MSGFFPPAGELTDTCVVEPLAGIVGFVHPTIRHETE
jgi:hypothetical protein